MSGRGMGAAGSDPLPRDYLPEFRERIERRLRILGLSTDDVVEDLAIAGLDFRYNRKLDQQSRTAGHLKRELLELASRRGSGIAAKLSILDEFELGAFFGEAPGASVELSIDGGGWHRRLLPDDDALHAAAFRTLSRLGDDGVPSTGLVYRRRTETIADRIPKKASTEELSEFVVGLATIIRESNDFAGCQGRRIGLIADHLVGVGSLGSTTLRSELGTTFGGLDLDGRAAFVAEIARHCLEEAAAAGDLAHGLTQLILEEFLGRITSGERRPTLMLFARCFPDALAEFTQVLAERYDSQYRLEDAARAARRDARRWHEAHAGWKLIDDVLQAVWPDAGKKLNPRQRDAVFAIVEEITKFFGGDQADRPQPALRRRQVDGVWESDNVANVANVSVNREHVAVLASLRSAIHKLDTVLHVLNRRALLELEPNSRTDPEARRKLDELRGTIGAAEFWRNQLDEKRHRGDYERNALSEPRATGARIALPRMPQVKAEGLAENEVAIQKIAAAAQMLIPHIS